MTGSDLTTGSVETARWCKVTYWFIALFGDCGGAVVKVLCYKSEDHCFDLNWCHSNFALTWDPYDCTMTLGSTQSVTKKSARTFPGGKGGRCVRLTTYHHPVPLSWNLGTLSSWNPLGLSRPVMGLRYLYLLQLLKRVLCINQSDTRTCELLPAVGVSHLEVSCLQLRHVMFSQLYWWRFKSFGMWHRVDWSVVTTVSE